MKIYDDWIYVPSFLKTKSQFREIDQKVLKSEQPRACVQDDKRLIYLYELDQTFEFLRTPREVAFAEYYSTFCGGSDKNTYRLLAKDGGQWSTKSADDLVWSRISKQKIKQHINGKTSFALTHPEKANFICLDHDLHCHDRHIFLDQTAILLEQFYGNDGWHLELDTANFNGCHYLQILNNSTEISKITERVREKLIGLDEKYPDLKKNAISAGMKPFSELEIFPDKGKYIRLPLGANRTLYLNEPLESKNKNSLIVYMNWHMTPEKGYYPKDKILKFLPFAIDMSKGFDRPSSNRLNSNCINAKIANMPEKTISNDSSWKGNGIRFLRDYWLRGLSNGKPLNEHVLYLGRLCFCFTAALNLATVKIIEFCLDLQNPARSECSRLRNNKKKLRADVANIVRRIYSGIGNEQLEPLYGLLQNAPKFNPLDKSTWGSLGQSKSADIVIDLEMDRFKLLIDDLILVLYDKRIKITRHHKNQARLFVKKLIALVVVKEKHDQGIKYEYLEKWISSNFPKIKVGRRNKISEIMKLFQKRRILFLKHKGVKGKFGNKYGIDESVIASITYA